MAVLAVPQPADPPALHAGYVSAVPLALSRPTLRKVRRGLANHDRSVDFDLSMAGYIALRLLSSAKEAIYESRVVADANGTVAAVVALTTRALGDVYQLPMLSVSTAVEHSVRAVGTGDFTGYLTQCYPGLDLRVLSTPELSELNQASQAALTARTAAHAEEVERILQIPQGTLVTFLQGVR